VDRDIRLDLDRQLRIGLDEAILCARKTTANIDEILDRVASSGGRCLLTRLEQGSFTTLAARHRDRLDYDAVSRTAYFGAPNPMRAAQAAVAVISAGTSDAPVSREAARTLRYYGEPALEIADVGVAGLWRLTERLPEIRPMRVLIVVAGMDAALPTVLGGLVAGLIVGVPTSVGYGVAEGGRAALHSMLASCSPGVVVTNIDNGYGAACAALRALRGPASITGRPAGA
jgi:hypothetical protein